MRNANGKSQNMKQVSRFTRILKEHKPELAGRYKVKSLGIFGSYLRGEQRARSDLDVLVEFDDDTLSLLKFIEMERYLSELLGVKVDLVEKSGLRPAIGRRILEEVKPI